MAKGLKNLAATLFLLLWFLIGLSFIFFGIKNFASGLKVSRGEGMAGVLRVEERDCAHAGCVWYGTFSPSGGGEDIPDVSISDLDRSTQVGANLRVIYVDGRAYYGEGPRQWVIPLIFIAAGVAITGYMTWSWFTSGKEATTEPGTP